MQNSSLAGVQWSFWGGGPCDPTSQNDAGGTITRRLTPDRVIASGRIARFDRPDVRVARFRQPRDAKGAAIQPAFDSGGTFRSARETYFTGCREQAQDGEVWQFGILVAIGLAAGQPSRCAEILYIDPEAQTALSRPARAELGLIGVNIHRFRDNAPLDLAREAGFRFARADLLWERVERDGTYRFRTYDALMNALEARGMGALLILDYGHPDHGGKVPRTAEDIAAFGRFAEAAARRFKGRDVRYEIWNEPNIVQFWPPGPNAREYAATAARGSVSDPQGPIRRRRW